MKSLLLCCFSIFLFQSTAQVLIHSYELNGTYADDFGGSPIVPGGGTLTPTSYEFDGGEGLDISNVINPYSYALEINFTLLETNYWRKLVDFKDGNSDNGIYVNDGRLYFYPDATSGYPVIEPDIPYTLTITRDGATKIVIVYIDGIEYLSFEDNHNRATFTGPGNIIHFMRDDFRLPPLEGHDPENPSGSLDYVKIYEPEIDPCGTVDSDCDDVNDDCDFCPGRDDNGPCDATSVPPLDQLPYNWLCSNNNNSDKILICHQGTTMCVSENSANTHLSHGDFLGPCTSCAQNFATPGSINNFVTATGRELLHQVMQEEIDTMERIKPNQFQVFPNPTSAEIQVMLPEVNEEGTLRILSFTGQEMHTLPLRRQKTISLDLSGYSAGIYLIDIRSANVHIQEKFVKI